MNPQINTSYLGLGLTHPLIASAGPLTRDVDGFRRLEDGGAAAIVMHSLFEEEILETGELTAHFMDYGSETFGEALSYFPEPKDYQVGPDAHLALLCKAKDAVDIPIIGSLNGVTPSGWKDYAMEMEQAGADALELNLYNLASNPEVSGARVEQQYLDTAKEVRDNTSLPLAVKISPFFSSPAHMMSKLADAGAEALVLFNRFYQPDLDIEQLEVVPNLQLSSHLEMRLPLRWVALLYGRIATEFAITSGVTCGKDILKGLMAGANVVMATSEVLRKGPGRIREMVGELETWMQEFEYESVQQMIGSLSQQNCSDPEAFERANYRKVLQSWKPDPSLGHHRLG